MWLQICVKPTSPATRFNPMDNYNEKWRRCGQARTTPSRSGFDTTYIREHRMEGSVREEFSIRRRRQGGSHRHRHRTGRSGGRSRRRRRRRGTGEGGSKGGGVGGIASAPSSPSRREVVRRAATRDTSGRRRRRRRWGAGDLGVWDLLRLGPWRISLFCAVLSCWFLFLKY